MQTYITLNDGTKIPQFGLGVYQIPEGEATYNAVLDALKIGVRHIDTAHAYQNERSVARQSGTAAFPVKKCGSPQSSGLTNTARARPLQLSTRCLTGSVPTISTFSCCISSSAIISVPGRTWRRLLR